MSKKVDDVKCPGCKAPIKFNVKKQMFICDYCKSSFTIEDIKKSKSNKPEKKVDDTNYVEYNCAGFKTEESIGFWYKKIR